MVVEGSERLIEAASIQRRESITECNSCGLTLHLIVMSIDLFMTKRWCHRRQPPLALAEDVHQFPFSIPPSLAKTELRGQ